MKVTKNYTYHFLVLIITYLDNEHSIVLFNEKIDKEYAKSGFVKNMDEDIRKYLIPNNTSKFVKMNKVFFFI